MRTLRWLLLAIPLCVVPLTAAPAAAVDFCISQGVGVTFVGQDFKVPAKGKCRAWHGFLDISGLPPSISTGTGCTSSDGSTFRLNLWSAREASAFSSYITLPLPGLTSGVNNEVVPNSTGTTRQQFTGLAGAACSPRKVPIP